MHRVNAPVRQPVYYVEEYEPYYDANPPTVHYVTTQGNRSPLPPSPQEPLPPPPALTPEELNLVNSPDHNLFDVMTTAIDPNMVNITLICHCFVLCVLGFWLLSLALKSWKEFFRDCQGSFVGWLCKGVVAVVRLPAVVLLYLFHLPGLLLQLVVSVVCFGGLLFVLYRFYGEDALMFMGYYFPAVIKIAAGNVITATNDQYLYFKNITLSYAYFG